MGISVGVIGLGQFGAHFVSLFKHHPLVDRLALCDVRADRLAEVAARHGITETYASLDDICRSDIQALAIITQPWLHAPQAVQAMRAGKHVYSAVPIMFLPSGDEMLDWCDRIIQTSRQTGLRYMMGETSFYRPQAMYCRRQAAAGAFGHFVLAEGSYFHDVDLPNSNLRAVGKARWGDKWSDAKRGDIPMHYPTHSFGGFLSVMPDARVTKVSCCGFRMPGDDWHVRGTEMDSDIGSETAMCYLSNGAAARVCEFRRIGHPGYEGFNLYGTEGSFVETPGGNFWLTKTQKTPLDAQTMRDPLPPDVDAACQAGDAKNPYGGHGGSHAYLVHEFVSALAENRQPAVNAWVAARYFAPGVIAHKSALKDGELLPVPDWGDAPS